MDISILIIAIVVLGIVGLLAFQAGRKRRTTHLRDRFGPEYDRVASKADHPKAAEAELEARERRHSTFELRPLDTAAAARYQKEWRDAQSHFVDSPSTAIREADDLITSVMQERGYPMDRFDQRAADLSVEYPDVVNEYRAAHRVAKDNERGQATTEDLRGAMVHYRSLFERLVDTSGRTQEKSR
ncbi:MAG: hypothetical protein ACRDYA_05090 [Egibacteraceae bacterium]